MADLNSFMLILALGPLAIYFLTIAIIHFTGKPTLTSGSRDLFVLGCGLIGMVFVGPIELFFPSNAMINFGMYVWFALAALYFLVVLLVSISLRPQWVVYGANYERTREAVHQAALRLDPQARLTDEFVDLPATGLRLRVDGVSASSACRVVAISNRVFVQQWSQLRKELAQQLAAQGPSSRQPAWMLIAAALALLAVLWVKTSEDPQAVARGFQIWMQH